MKTCHNFYLYKFKSCNLKIKTCHCLPKGCNLIFKDAFLCSSSCHSEPVSFILFYFSICGTQKETSKKGWDISDRLALAISFESVRFHPSCIITLQSQWLGCEETFRKHNTNMFEPIQPWWSRGIIHALGERGFGFKSRTSPWWGLILNKTKWFKWFNSKAVLINCNHFSQYYAFFYVVLIK